LFRAAIIATLLALSASTAGAQGARWDDQSQGRIRRHDHSGAHIRVAGNYELPKDATSGGPIVVIGGHARIDGHADDDVVIVGGSADIGPTAVIDGDLVMVGGNTNVDPAAKIYGEVQRARISWPDVNVRWPMLGDWWSRTFAFGATVIRLCIILFGGVLITLVAPGSMTRMSQRVSDMPGISAIIGFATEMFVAPAIAVIAIALAISIVGIPLLAGIPVLLAALAVVWIAGFAATAARLGASIRGEHASWLEPRAGDFILGFVVLTAVTIAGRVMALGPSWVTPAASMVTSVGLFIEYCAWTLGLGAAMGAIFAGHRTPRVPPIPPLPASTS
jgi:hypothetical protein